VGKEILRLLERMPLPVGELIPMASPACNVHSVDFRNRARRVENLHADSLESCDVVFFAVPAEVGERWLTVAQDLGVAIIDLTGVMGPERDVPQVVLPVNRSELQAFPEILTVGSPRPEVVALCTLLAPIRAQVGGLTCRGTVLHSASLRGRAGIEELSKQVVSLFNSRTPERLVFPQGLAFDVEPLVGEAGPSGWAWHEDRCAMQSAAILGLQPSQLALNAIIAPWFNGLCLSLHLVADRPLRAGELTGMLRAAPGIDLSESFALADLPRPRGADGKLSLQVGRLRDDPAGYGAHVWAVADELRCCAAGNAVGILAALLEDDLL